MNCKIIFFIFIRHLTFWLPEEWCFLRYLTLWKVVRLAVENSILFIVNVSETKIKNMLESIGNTDKWNGLAIRSYDFA